MPVVLVVDDSAVDRHVVKELLAREAGLDWLIEYAENGRQALEIMQDIRCDVVVTDLQMPEIDGLELVTTMRSQFPDVPSIIFTGRGSEAIAMKALEKGASSYVPKQHAADRLVSTIRQVIATSQATIHHKNLFETIVKIQVEFNLHNDVALVRPLVDHVEEILSDIKFLDHTERVHIGVALEEALLNAMLHGNMGMSVAEVKECRALMNLGKPCDELEKRRKEEPYKTRCVRTALSISHHEAKFVIRDEGAGFSADVLPERGNPESLQPPYGSGLVLIHHFMDEVTFNETHNQLTMVKRAE